jgi:hypothetical protein
MLLPTQQGCYLIGITKQYPRPPIDNEPIPISSVNHRRFEFSKSRNCS